MLDIFFLTFSACKSVYASAFNILLVPQQTVTTADAGYANDEKWRVISAPSGQSFPVMNGRPLFMSFTGAPVCFSVQQYIWECVACVCAWVCVYNGIYRCKFLCVNGVALCDLYPLLPFKCLRSAFDASSAPSIFVCCRFCCWWQQLAIAPTTGCNVFSSVDYDNCCHSVIHSFAQMTMTIKPTPKSKPKWQQQQCAAGARHMIASTACAHICHTWLAFTAT